LRQRAGLRSVEIVEQVRCRRSAGTTQDVVRRGPRGLRQLQACPDVESVVLRASGKRRESDACRSCETLSALEAFRLLVDKIWKQRAVVRRDFGSALCG